MKKRIKLTDKELAIGMWVYICLHIESYDRKSSELKWIVSLKKEWLEKHYKRSYTVSPDFYWTHDCWFCNRYWKILENGCLGCPLGSCGTDSLYDGVTKYYQSIVKQEKALRCAKHILNTIIKAKEEDDE